MEQERAAPLAGVASCLAVVVALAYPYLAVGAGVGAYYGSGLVNPLVAALLALVGTIAFAAGREGRSDPEFVAGAALVFGLFVAVILLAWAATVRPDVVEISPLHRWLAAAAGVLVPASGLWYARSLGLV